MQDTHVIAPGATIGILGGGQLGRMIAVAAAKLGYRTLVFEPQADCPASHVSAHRAADYGDVAALDSFADAVDVVTLEFENVPVDVLTRLATRVPVRPGARILEIAQDRVREKTFLNKAGIKTAPWAPVTDRDSLYQAVETIGPDAILKSSRFGYDGKGQVRLSSCSTPEEAWHTLGNVPAILEGIIDFRCEISVIAARAPDGRITCFPAVQNEHRNAILYRTIAPAPLEPSILQNAALIARTAIEAFECTGLLCVELFVTSDGQILANEVAPRPHNSGHWTIEGARTSQFEQLVRSICNLPLGDTRPIAPSEMINLLGDDIDGWSDILSDPSAHLHLYGKTGAKPGRKMGHVTRLITD